MYRKQTFEIPCFFPEGFAAPPPPPPRFYLLFSVPPRLFYFSFPVFFSFIGHLLDFLLVAKGFTKSSKIVNFLGKKYEWVVGQDFQWNFLVKVTRFFASFSGLFDLIALIWACLKRSLLLAQVSCQSCPRQLKLMTSRVVQGTWLNKGGHVRFRGQCVNTPEKLNCPECLQL